ncbi:hypothetical protein OFO10_00395 [Campylobacter sp. VBCF_06 NA8]|uniref:hypothetical protein n=1 Tax=unclassified Campylobacter TaxID=2593542 RepID=UPI0022E9A386|nr:MULTISPECIES: hypothetical protein [unclassified Campylobacter]MDA3045618.1 hypothetical protein [Campylobacter sp. VBCF_06 NA8]MDA3054724.1 hypothetical protein [Campylobacter sp. VBCF_07 NA4]
MSRELVAKAELDKAEARLLKNLKLTEEMLQTFLSSHYLKFTHKFAINKILSKF